MTNLIELDLFFNQLTNVVLPADRKRHFSGPQWPNRPHGSTYLCHCWKYLTLSELVSVLVCAK